MEKSAPSSYALCEFPYKILDLNSNSELVCRIASVLGLLVHIYVQEPAYGCVSMIGPLTSPFSRCTCHRKHHASRGPEARLYGAMGAGIGLVGSLFMYAWCTFPNVHWIALCIAIVVRLYSTQYVNSQSHDLIPIIRFARCPPSPSTLPSSPTSQTATAPSPLLHLLDRASPVTYSGWPSRYSRTRCSTN